MGESSRCEGEERLLRFLPPTDSPPAPPPAPWCWESGTWEAPPPSPPCDDGKGTLAPCSDEASVEGVANPVACAVGSWQAGVSRTVCPALLWAEDGSRSRWESWDALLLPAPSCEGEDSSPPEFVSNVSYALSSVAKSRSSARRPARGFRMSGLMALPWLCWSRRSRCMAPTM